MDIINLTTLAWLNTLNSTAIIGSAGFGLSIFLISWTIIRLLSTDDMQQEDEWSYDVNRINELRKASLMYRICQPLIQSFAIINRRAFASELPEISREIQAAGYSRFWTAAEYLGKIELTSCLLLPFYLYLCMEFMGPPGIVLALLMVVITAYFLRRSLSKSALYRITKIKRRLPFMLDLMTLLMEAGSTFLDALKESVAEFRGHPAGVEFGRILGEMRMGKTRTSALESMRERLQDDEITSIVGSIIQGENQGTPLALLFRTQADVLRVKRTQRAETIAGEAGVKMLLPGLLVMIATLLIILGPFVLRFFVEDFLS